MRFLYPYQLKQWFELLLKSNEIFEPAPKSNEVFELVPKSDEILVHVSFSIHTISQL